ncbi:MAG: alpha/beta fold hydrolase [Anaerolinea sp.]|nr:alpha/beta fold hydrolase [Anaerolinea sp.]
MPTATALPTATPDPYAQWTVEGLAARAYGDGELQIEQLLAVTDAFTRTLITFPSDGLTIYGFMNVPQGEGPFPVVLTLHGYVDPARYQTLTYTTGYADALARAGYLVIHPNFRNWPPSDSGPEDYRVGQAVDVLNLLALVQEMGGQPGPLAQADPERIGIWGHSMGGGIAQRVIAVSDAVDAAVLYGSMSGDEALNHERILWFTNGARGLWDQAPPADALQRISPINYLDRVTAAVSIHHGDQDDQVPLAWSEDLCARLQALGKPVECFTYPGQPHTFVGEGNQLFMQRVRDFFGRMLGGGGG